MKIALIGYGKMGKAIAQVAEKRNHEVVFTIDKDNTDDLNPTNLANIDVAIEFSEPGAAYDNIVKCFKSNTPVVTGTTGWPDKFEEIKKQCKEGNQTLFYASNFSLGMNLVFTMNKQLAKWMNSHEEYDVSIDETHHSQKLDSPSGTAITLAKGILENIDRKSNWINKAADNPEQLSVTSHREEKVPGIHNIKYVSSFDSIEITHTAHSREGFALGALVAAEWIAGKKGIFTMDDLLNTNNN